MCLADPDAPHPGTRFPAAFLSPPRGSRQAGSRRSFFKSFLRRRIALWMLWADGETTVSERRQYFSNRALMQIDTKASLDLIAQIDAPPANNLMRRRARAALAQRRQLRALR